MYARRSATIPTTMVSFRERHSLSPLFVDTTGNTTFSKTVCITERSRGMTYKDGEGASRRVSRSSNDVTSIDARLDSIGEKLENAKRIVQKIVLDIQQSDSVGSCALEAEVTRLKKENNACRLALRKMQKVLLLEVQARLLVEAQLLNAGLSPLTRRFGSQKEYPRLDASLQYCV